MNAIILLIVITIQGYVDSSKINQQANHDNIAPVWHIATNQVR